MNPLLPLSAPMQAPTYTPSPQAPYGGTQQSNTTTTVIMQQPVPISHHVLEIKPPNYLILSIITMLFFCWIFGLVALIVGSQVRNAGVWSV